MNSLTAALAFSILIDGNDIRKDVVNELDINLIFKCNDNIHWNGAIGHDGGKGGATI